MFGNNRGKVLSAIAMAAILALAAPGLAGGATLAELRQAVSQADQAYSRAQRDHANGDITFEELEAARENLRYARKESWKAGDEASRREYQEFIATLSPVDEDPAPPPAPDAGADDEAPAAPLPADDENGNPERDLPQIDIPLGVDPPRLSHDENGNPVVDGALGEGGGELPPEDPLDVYHRASADVKAVRERFEDDQATELELEAARERLREAWRQWWKARQTAEQSMKHPQSGEAAHAVATQLRTRVDYSGALLRQMIVARPVPLGRDPMQPEGFDATEVEVLSGLDEAALAEDALQELIEPVAVEHEVEIDSEPQEWAD